MTRVCIAMCICVVGNGSLFEYSGTLLILTSNMHDGMVSFSSELIVVFDCQRVWTIKRELTMESMAMSKKECMVICLA